MQEIINPHTVLFLIGLLLPYFISAAVSKPFIGLDINMDFEPLPTADKIVKFMNSTGISKVRINYAHDIIEAFADMDVNLTVDTIANGVLHSLGGQKESYAETILHTLLENDLHKKVHMLLTGDKIFEYGTDNDTANLVPFMQAMQTVIDKEGLRGKIKVSTVISTDSLINSHVPSESTFKPAYLPVIVPLLHFLRRTGSPLHISVFPYFYYLATQTLENLNFCLFGRNPGRVDPFYGVKYTNLFALKVDSMKSALNGMLFNDIEIVVAETGWPSWGNDTEVEASLEASRLYNTNLIHYLRSTAGTPLMPKRPVDTYLFSLFDTNAQDQHLPHQLKSCGIAYNNLTWKYNIHFLKE